MKGFVRRHQLCRPGDRILIALSGGQDSVCLLHLFKCLAISWGLELHACHFEHGIRGEESLRDADFARRVAEAWHVDFSSGSGNARELASGEGISCQEAARLLRYRFFHKVREKIGADRIATAHTATDQAEEVLIRMLRGAGPAGLSGIPVRNGCVTRPLLWAEREEITDYLERRSIPFVTDSSNHDRHYLRNSIRLELIPFLKEKYNPSIIRTLNRNAELMAIEDRALEGIAARAFERCCPGAVQGGGERLTIECALLAMEEEAVRRRVILRFLVAGGVPAARLSYSQIRAVNDIVMSRDRSSREIHLPGKFLLRFDNGFLSISGRP
jgi:tRNA(Ile)-lysidine synthase